MLDKFINKENNSYYNLAEVEDYGIFWKVISTITNESIDLVGISTIPLNNLAAEVIDKALSLGKSVRIMKELIQKEVLIRDLRILDKDEVDELILYRDNYKTKARKQINHHMANIHGIQLYEFYNINNKLCSNGFFVHDDNKEEIYLQILETGDEQLIDDLETYLNVRDDLSRQSALEKVYRKFYADLEDTESKEAADKIFNEFKEKFDDMMKKCTNAKINN